PDHSNDEVADQPEAGTLYDLTGEPSCNNADHDYHEQTFARHVHLRKLQLAYEGTIRLCSRSFHSTSYFVRLLCRFAHLERHLYPMINIAPAARTHPTFIASRIQVMQNVAGERQGCSFATRLAMITNA